MSCSAELSLENVSWKPAGGDEPILHATNFTLKPGRILGIVGPNGAGKSSLLRTIYRFNRPTTGAVKIDGEDLWKMHPRAAARTVAAVLQEQTGDFALTVRDIVALGRLPHRLGFSSPGPECADIIERVMKRTQLEPLADRQIGTLSGGERQRVMLARALAQAPRLMVLDEPTNHLDIHHQLELLELVKELANTVVVSLHDINMAADFCDDVLVLKKGRQVAFGPPDDVLTEDLVSGAFRVRAQREMLSVSETNHFTFELNA